MMVKQKVGTVNRKRTVKYVVMENFKRGNLEWDFILRSPFSNFVNEGFDSKTTLLGLLSLFLAYIFI